MIVVLVLIAVSMGVIGQMLLKLGAHTPVHHAADLIRNLFGPLTLAGLSMYGVATLLWLTALSRAALSYVYPMLGLNYVLVVLLSGALLHEAIPIQRWIGVLLVALGFVVVATS